MLAMDHETQSVRQNMSVNRENVSERASERAREEEIDR